MCVCVCICHLSIFFSSQVSIARKVIYYLCPYVCRGLQYKHVIIKLMLCLNIKKKVAYMLRYDFHSVINLPK